MMKQQKYYNNLQQHILLLIGLSLIPGFVYLAFGWIFNIFLPAFIWYSLLIVLSIWGIKLYKQFETEQMSMIHLTKWYQHLSWFMYTIFSSWTVIFIFYAQETINHLNYIAIFTQLGASVIASTLLVSDKKLYTPILMTLLFPLALYFAFFDTWYGYVLSLFSVIFMLVLDYSATHTNKLLQENYFHAHHDILTGLYNRKHFTEHMEALYERLKKHGAIAYINLIDLDYFKTINDSLGHDYGDKLLINVAERLEKYSKGSHIVCRLGGDEFVLVSYELKEHSNMQTEAYNSSKKLLEIIKEPYHIGEHILRITASIGLYKLDPLIAKYDENSFIKEVDIAMYEAKEQGRDGVILFNEALALSVDRHLLIERKLYDALKNNIIEIYYQPQFNKEANLSGCEALLRWRDSELGVITPDEFIPIAETRGLILEVGSYVLRKTFSVLYQWNKKGYYFDSFSINISIRQLINDAFFEEVEGLIKEFFPISQNKQKIFFEITEHVFAQDMKKVICVMNKIKDLGISFSIDDFGTGYSSLSYLKELPVDEVKIDKSFVDTIGEIDKATNMIKTIISIAKNFNFKIVAEGVETLEQFDLLVAENCDIFQGFHFDKAITKECFEEKYFS